MPRARIETAFLGWQTVLILHGVPLDQAGWLIHALCDWIVDDHEPEDIPPECIGSWIAIRDESIRIHDAREGLRERGRNGGRKAKGKQKESKGEAKEKQKESKRKAKGNQDREEDRDRDISSVSSLPETEAEAPVRVGAPAREAVAGLPASDSVSDSVSVFTGLDLSDDSAAAIAALPERHLVPAALQIIRETGNARMRGRLNKFRREYGGDELRSVLQQFVSELDAGEIPANLGATLNAKLTAHAAFCGK